MIVQQLGFDVKLMLSILTSLVIIEISQKRHFQKTA